jgi:hypothetical protein
MKRYDSQVQHKAPFPCEEYTVSLVKQKSLMNILMHNFLQLTIQWNFEQSDSVFNN